MKKIRPEKGKEFVKIGLGGKVALIAGARRRIGKTTAIRFAGKGKDGP